MYMCIAIRGVAKVDAATAVLKSARYERELATSTLASASWPCSSAMAMAGVVCDIVMLFLYFRWQSRVNLAYKTYSYQLYLITMFVSNQTSESSLF